MLLKYQGNDGELPKISYGNRKLSVSYMCPDVLSHVESKILELAIRSVEKRKLPNDIKDKLLRSIELDIDAEQFSVGGDRWNAVFKGNNSVTLILWSCIYDQNKDVTLDDAEKIVRANLPDLMPVLKLVVPNFFVLMGQEAEVPTQDIQKMLEEVDKLIKELEKKLALKEY